MSTASLGVPLQLIAYEFIDTPNESLQNGSQPQIFKKKFLEDIGPFCALVWLETGIYRAAAASKYETKQTLYRLSYGGSATLN